MSEDDVLDEDHVMLDKAAARVDSDFLPFQSLAEVEKREIVRVLRNCRGNRSQAAALLGINRKTLREKMRKYGILYDESLSTQESSSTLQ